MDQTKALKIINPCLFLTISFQVLSCILMDFLGSSLPNFIFTFHAAGDWLILFFGLLHIAYNWQWIKTNYFS